jgi:hypothetical protein
VLLAVAVTLAPACSKQDDQKLELEKIIRRTSPLSHQFVYTYEALSQAIVVRGVIQDDFRYKTRVTLNGKDVIDEVVADDALALRFLDPTLLPNFITEAASEPTALEALAAQRWVLDKDGAPALGASAVEEKGRGADPIVDALTVLDYLKLSLGDAGDVRIYNPESILYRAEEDPFPKPEHGSGIKRYDLIPKDFPIANAKGPDGAPIFPTIGQFRKVGVYVQDGVIIQIRERVAAEGKILKDLEGFVNRFVEDQGGKVASQFKKRLAALTGDARTQLLLDFLNIGIRSSGNEEVRFRSSAYEFQNLGQPHPVSPPKDVIAGDLGFFGVNPDAGSSSGNTGP